MAAPDPAKFLDLLVQCIGSSPCGPTMVWIRSTKASVSPWPRRFGKLTRIAPIEKGRETPEHLPSSTRPAKFDVRGEAWRRGMLSTHPASRSSDQAQRRIQLHHQAIAGEAARSTNQRRFAG